MWLQNVISGACTLKRPNPIDFTYWAGGTSLFIQSWKQPFNDSSKTAKTDDYYRLHQISIGTVMAGTLIDLEGTKQIGYEKYMDCFHGMKKPLTPICEILD